MGELAGRRIKNTYQDLIRFENSGQGADATLRSVEDGLGNTLPLQLSTSALVLNSALDLNGSKITNVNSSTIFEDVNGNTILKLYPRTDSDSYITIDNRDATSGGPVISVASNHADCNLVIGTKGAGVAWIRNLSFASDADANTNKIFSLGNPTSNQDAATKYYVDTEDATMAKTDGSRPFTGDLTVNGVIDTEGLLLNGESPTFGYKNWIQNPKFNIWQRVASQAVSGWTADRWHQWVDGGGAKTTYFLDAHAVDIGGGSVINFSVSSMPTYHTIEQHIRDGALFALSGKTCSFSFWMWATSSTTTPVNVDIVQWFGNGSVENTDYVIVPVGTYTITQANTWEKKTFTFDIPSLAGKTLGSEENQYLRPRIWLPNAQINAASTVRLTMVQLEEGPPTDFEYRPDAIEQKMCERYYQKSYPDDYYAGSDVPAGFIYSIALNTYATSQFTVTLPTPMRKAPLLTVYAPYVSNVSGHFRGFTTSTNHQATIDQQSFQSFRVYATNHDLTVSYDYRYHWVADAE